MTKPNKLGAASQKDNFQGLCANRTDIWQPPASPVLINLQGLTVTNALFADLILLMLTT
ncbi:hypothetical protein ACJJI5_22260 [Microbulbifer sp. EKSA008]|uniref:hypothetical protein n=1 Tax=Microbulbifer sp. EKSA008 TaxID=3243367 RepID=UPI00404359BD